MRRDKKREEILSWLSWFANLNLDEIKPGDKAKVLVEAKEYLFPFLTWKERIGKEIPQIVEEIPWAFEPLSEHDDPRYWEKIKTAQNAIKQGIEELIDFCAEGVNINLLVVRTLLIENIEDKIWFSHIPITSYENYFRLRVHLLLDGYPPFAIRKCPGCSKYFFNPTLREKNFCSPRCMWKVKQQERREALKKEPEKYQEYLRKQREIMQKKYQLKKEG